MLTQPGHLPGVVIFMIFIEDNDHSSNFTGNLLKLSDIESAFMPIAQSLANVDSVQQRSGKRLRVRALLGKQAFAFLLEKEPVVLQHNVFGRIGTNSPAVELTGPFTRELLFLPTLQAQRTDAGFLAR